MLDVEGRVVAGVVLVGIQGTGGVEGVGVRVNIKVTLDFTGHDVGFSIDGTGSALLTVGSVADEVEGEFVGKFEAGVHVSGVTLHGALEGPARILHHGQGGVVVGLLGTA